MSDDLELRREALIRAIAHDRNQLASAVDELEDVVRSHANVGAKLGKRIIEKPYHWLGAGLVVGMILGFRRR